MIMRRSKVWFGKIVTESEMDAVKKRVSNAHDKYCALGVGDNILVMTLSKILPDSHAVGFSQLPDMIEHHLNCGYGYRLRRFRHSNGLFPPKPKPITPVHIERRYASSESPKAVVERFMREGYEETMSPHGHAHEYYLRPGSAEHTVDEVLATGLKYLEWSE
jgi:hypothetical protein